MNRNVFCEWSRLSLDLFWFYSASLVFSFQTIFEAKIFSFWFFDFILKKTSFHKMPTDETNFDFVGIQFCRECNNMLYPKEDKEKRTLMFACRNCNFKQAAKSPCIYLNRMVHEVEYVYFSLNRVLFFNVFSHPFIVSSLVLCPTWLAILLCRKLAIIHVKNVPILKRYSSKANLVTPKKIWDFIMFVRTPVVHTNGRSSY